jgi:hypothetical protein
MKKIITVSVISIFLVIAILFGMGMFGKSLTNKFDNAIPRKYAIEKAQNNQELIQLIGENIIVEENTNQDKTKGSFTFSLGSDGFDMNQNSIDLKIELKGDKDNAILNVIAYKSDTKWIYEELSVLVPSVEKKIIL